MYTRDFGEGIRSEGNLRDYMQSASPPKEEYRPPEPPQDQPPEETKTVPVFGGRSAGDGIIGGIKKLLRDVEIDDLILIGIGILLLLDSDADNDMLVILILLMLFI